MPTLTREIPLCRYHYDPLDRMVDSTPFEQSTIQRYYCKTRLATELQGVAQRTIVQHDDQLLAQQQGEGGKVAARLLATDQQRSVLNALDANQPNPLAYSPYGHRPPENGLLSLLGFNGERPDPVTGHYHLGNGYRQFNPALMRFNCPDSWSPFGKGGLNAYAYCGGDPQNRIDPTGHSFGFLALFGRSNSIARVPTSSAEIVSTAAGIANMKQGMLYQGKTLGYQLGEKSSKLNLDKKSITEIEAYTNVIKDNNAKLVKETKNLLTQMPDGPEKLKAIKDFEERVIQFPTVDPITSKDIAVRELHAEAMYFADRLNFFKHIETTLKSTPAKQNTSIRQLT